MAKTKIILVDDEVLAIQLLKKSLERRDYEVETATNGMEALALLNEQSEVLVTDLVMPEMDGIALLTEARAQFANLITVAITSFADKELAIAALNAGADYLMEKPFTADELHHLLQSLMQKQEQHIQGHISGAVMQQLRTCELSAKEEEVVVYILQGLANKQIAVKLDIREQSVKNRISSVYAKLEISSRSELFHKLFPLQ